MRELYDYGLPFSKLVADNVDALMDRIDRKKASLIIIDGLMGEGKTTLGVEIGQYVELTKSRQVSWHFWKDWKFDLSKQLALGGIDFQEKLQLCHDSDLHVVVYDEAGDFGKRGAISAFNRDLNRIFQTFRAYKILVICCLPSFDILDNEIFKQGVPRLLLNCHGRDLRSGDIRGYGLEEMFYLKRKMKELVNPMKAYQFVRPNFRGHFLDLEPGKSAQLHAISIKGKKEVLSKSIIRNQGLICVSEIAKKLNRSVNWVRQKLRTMKHFKPVKIYKKTKYYEEQILLVLEEELKYKT